MKRVWHHYEKWEEYRAGMWRKVSKSEHDAFLPKAIEFTGNAELYGSAMLRVIQEWPISCEHNLTDLGQNRRAWIGHAAATIAIGCPEYITREAWGHLSEKQQIDANAKADEAVAKWELTYALSDSEIHNSVGGSGLPRNPTSSTGDSGSIGKGAIVSCDMSSDSEERHSMPEFGIFEATDSGLHDVEADRDFATGQIR